jgi:hypothetical protein
MTEVGSLPRLSFWQTYGKSLVAAIFAVYTVVVPLWTGDHHIDPSEGIIIALAIGNNVLVYIVPLTARFGGVKSVVSAVMAALVVAQTQIAGGLDGNDILLIVGALLATLGVVVAPAFSPKQRVKVSAGSDVGIPV